MKYIPNTSNIANEGFILGFKLYINPEVIVRITH